MPPSGTVSVCGSTSVTLVNGAVTANSLAPSTLLNAVGNVASNTTWTTASTAYFLATTVAQFSVQSTTACQCRDAEVTTWMRQGYVYFRLSGGSAIYFKHDGETANGTLRIGIVTGLNEASYPSGTEFLLYENTTLTSAPFSTAGYTRTNTDGQTFTFGVSGFDIYVKYNGTECVRFKEYRQMSSGAVAFKSNTGFGFRDFTVTPMTPVALLSDYASHEINMADWGVRALLTTGTIAATSTSLTVANPSGFRVGDFIVVEIGAETGAGARGTIGVGNSWPALSNATTAGLLALTPANNTFGWARDTGQTYRYQAGVWNQNAPWGPVGTSTPPYYPEQALPRSLQARITAIAGSVFTLDTAATATATNANVHLDNQLYFTDLLQPARSGLGPIAWTSMILTIPAGRFGLGGEIYISTRNGITLRGTGQSSSELFGINGMRGAGIFVQACPSILLKDFKLTGNLGNGRLTVAGPTLFGLNYITDNMKPVPSSTSATQYNVSGLILTVDSDNGAVDETTFLANWFYSGMNISSSDDAVVQDVTVNDVFTNAVAFNQLDNGWAYRVTDNVHYAQQSYTQWQMENATLITNGGMQDCVINASFMTAGYETFAGTGTQYIRCTANNASWSLNNAGAWAMTDCIVNISSGSITPGWSPNNFLVAITVNTGSDFVSAATISNVSITSKIIDSVNSIPRGIQINSSKIPDVTISGGFYTSPAFVGGSTVESNEGIFSLGANTQVSNFTCCVTLPSTSAFGTFNANIDLLYGGITNCQADHQFINGSTAAVVGASTCPP